MTDGLIELGDRPDVLAAGPPWRMSRPTLRRLLLGLVVVVVLLGVAGSAGRPPRLSDVLWGGQQIDEFQLGRRTLYTIESAQGLVRARELDTGEVRWTLAVPGAAAVAEVTPSTVIIIAPPPSTQELAEPGPGQDEPVAADPTLVLADVASGREIARQSGQLWPRFGGLVTIVRSVAGCSRTTACRAVVGLNPATGAEVWQILLPQRTEFVQDDVGRRLVTVEVDRGRVAVWLAATGQQQAEVELPAEFLDAIPSDRSVNVVGDVLVLGYGDGDETVFQGHPLTPSGRAWSARLPLPAVGTGDVYRFYVGSCTRMVCVSIDNTTTMIDPVTGAVRGRLPLDVIEGYSVDAGTADTMIGVSYDVNGGIKQFVMHVLRASDFVELASFPAANAVYWTGAHGWWLMALEHPGSTAFFMVNSRGYARPIGSVTGGQQQCLASGRALVCHTFNGAIRLWRLPDPADLTP